MKRITSWNVNGIRAAVRKGFTQEIRALGPEILCIQETKAQNDQADEALQELEEYHRYYNPALKKGYSGTGILSKSEPLKISLDPLGEEHNQEGRIISAEFKDFYLVNVYVPNSGNQLKRLDYRAEWDREFKNYLQKLQKSKPVILCGDLNVAHREIDLARPKENYNKTAGFTQTEIDGLDAILSTGLKDTFRELHPETVAYTFWSMRLRAREKNLGWRIDYFLVSEELFPKVQDVVIHDQVMGSDHCPVSLLIDI